MKPYVAEKPKTGNKLKDIGIAIANAAIKVANAALKLVNAVITLDNMFYVESATTRANQFRLPGKSSSKYTINIQAKDTNPSSATYNRVASTSAGSFAKASLQKDMGAALALWAGESKTTKELLEDSGVAHINCGLSLIPLCYIYNYPDGGAISPSNGEYKNSNVVIKGEAWGRTASMTVMAAKTLCAYHVIDTGLANSYIHVFRVPTVTPITGGFEITNTEEGVIYSAGDQSVQCKKDGEMIVFRDLCSNCEYEITLSHKNPDGRYSRKYVYATTPPPMYANLNYATGWAGLSYASDVVIENKGDKCTYPVNPTAYGTIITGWYSDSAMKQLYDFTLSVYQNFKLYGKWEKLKSSLTLNLTADGEVVKDEVVELYKNGSKAYTLDETSTEGTYYIQDSVYNDTYDLYINGLDTKYDLFVQTRRTERNLNAEQKAQLISGDNLTFNIELNKLETVTRLDGEVSILAGTTIEYFEPTGAHATVYKNNAYYTYFAGSDTTVYDIFYNGIDTDITNGKDSSKNVDKSNALRYLDFYTITVNAVTDDTDWVCNNMVLRNQNGKFIAKLTPGEYNEETGSRPYTAIMLKDENNPAIDLYIYVDGSDSQRTVTATAEGKNATISFITTEITVNQDDAPKTNAELNFQDGQNNQTVTANNNGVYLTHLINNDKNYSVTVTGAKDTAEHIVNTESTDLTLNYFTEKFMSSETVDDKPVYNKFKYREYIVYDGEVIAAPTGVYLEGATFSCWNTTEYAPGEANQQSFDFTAPITEKHTFYAHFIAPEVVIGDYVKTDEDGKLDGVGNSYMMPNLIIRGYDEEKIMLSAKISFSEIAGAKIPVMTNECTFETFSGKTPETVDGYYVIAEDDTIVFNLSEAVTPTELAAWLKGIIVTPNESVENSISIEVSNGASSVYTAEDWDYSRDFNNDTLASYKKITGMLVGRTLTSGKYYIEGNIVLDGTKYGTNGLVIDGNVIIYIPKGSSLTVIGANGNGAVGGKAGILVPEGSDLTVFGDGALTATGGNAGNGENGKDARSNLYDATKKGACIIRGTESDIFISGTGGAGGNGGGGAGAGIGTNGGAGGAGGNETAQIKATIYFKDFTHDLTIGGTAGQSGSDGSKADECGGFHCYGVALTANGGKVGTNGKGGTAATGDNNQNTETRTAVCTWYNATYSNIRWQPVATSASAGGGGGGGWNARAVGTGGTGGGGGGAGALGGYHIANLSSGQYSGKDRVAAYGGSGGAGANGTTGGVGAEGDPYHQILLNSSAAGGASDNTGTEITAEEYTYSESTLDELKAGVDETYEKLSDVTAGQKLTSGKYYIEGDVVLDGTITDTNGLVISGNVTIYIPEGSTLIAIGANGNGAVGGKAGVLVPEGSDLTVFGDGALIATGGNAGNGENGGNVCSDPNNPSLQGVATIQQSNGKYDVEVPDGGAGGNGGGGAGAGIGTNGGAGGAGAAKKSGFKTWGTTLYNGFKIGGDKGANGNDGSNADECGDFYSIGVSVTANGGASGNGGKGGTTSTVGRSYLTRNGGAATYSAKACCCVNFIYNGFLSTCTTSGGGGAGGGGWNAPGVGTGGTGGGGGGAGAIGAFSSSSAWDIYQAYGGNGGAGAVAGGNGSTYEMSLSSDFINHPTVASAGGASVNNTKEITANEYTDEGKKYTKITSLTAGQILTTGNYYVEGNFVLDGNETGTNGLVIDGKVKLYIPEGSSITAIGDDGSGQTAGKAAILLPEGSDLTVLGKGDLTVQGGKAGNGSNGGNAGGLSMYYYKSSDLNGYIDYSSGNSGAGGVGGGGAGAGIGTNGGVGGNGGSSTGVSYRIWYLTTCWDGYRGSYGQSSNAGVAGTKANNCGNFTCDSRINLTVAGGGAGAGGSGGTAATSVGESTTINKSWTGPSGYAGYDCLGYCDDGYYCYISLTSSGAGGGGGGGQKARAVGNGGTGGGGGSSGMNGNATSGKIDSWGKVWWKAQGGNGGAGGYNGNGGMGNYRYFSGNMYGGGSAAAGGASDNTGKEITYEQYSLTEPKYTVSFDATYFGGKSVEKTYTYFTQTNITVPELKAPAGLAFKSWVVTETGINLNGESTPLCKGDNTLYQPDDIITVDGFTSGNITLKPIFEVIKSKSAENSLIIPDDVFVPNPTPITYYTYTVKSTINGEAGSVGNITLKNGDTEYVLSPDANGSYSVVLTDDTSFDIFYDGKDTDVDATNEDAATLEFSSIVTNTKLDGKLNGTLGDIVLKGKKNVTMKPETQDNLNTGVYKLIGLTSDFEESYKVYIDNADIGVTVVPSDEKNVNYVTVKVALEGNTVPDSAYIVDENNNKITLNVAKDKLSAVALENTNPYTLYVNGLNTDTTVYLSGENTVTVNTVTVTTSLDGKVCDVEGFVPSYDGYAMEKTDDGTYTALIFSTPDKVGVKDRKLDTTNCELEVKLYTVTYDLGDGTGNLPVDSKIYFDGDTLTVSCEKSIFGKEGEFAGWSYLDENYVGLDEITVNAPVVLTAQYLPASEFDALISINGESHYYLFSQLETVLNSRNENDIVEITILKDCEALPSITLERDDKLTISENVVVTVPEGNELVNNGNITLLEGAKIILPEGMELENNGTITLESKAELTVPSGASLTNNGTLNIAEGAKLTSSGDFENNGTVENNGKFVYDGTKFLNTNYGTFNNNGILYINAPNAVNEGILNNCGNEEYDGSGDEPTHARLESDSEPANYLKNNGTINSDGGYIDLMIDNYAIDDGNHTNGIVNYGTCIDDGLVYGAEANEVENNEEGERLTNEEEERKAEQQKEDEKKAQDEEEKKKADALGSEINYYLMPEGGTSPDYDFDDQEENPLTYKSGTATDLPNNVVKPGYKILGWANSADMSVDLESGEFVYGEPVMQIGTDEYEELTFFAMWEEVEKYNDTQEKINVNLIPEQEVTLTKQFTSDIATVVGGLEEELSVLFEENPNKNINVDYKILKEDDPEKQDTENYNALAEAVDGNTKQYLDFQYTVTIGDDVQNRIESSSIFESVIAFNTFEKTNPEIVRYHDGEVQKFTESDSHEDLTFEIVGAGANAELHIFASKFCEGILSYNTTSSPITTDTKCQANITLNENLTVKMRVVGYDAKKADSELFNVTVEKYVETDDGELVRSGEIVAVEDITESKDGNGKPCIEATLASFRPSELDIPVHVVVTYDSGIVKEFDYSILSYCNKVISLSGQVSDKLVDLCKAVLNYGAAADNYLNDLEGEDKSKIDAGCVCDFDTYTIAKPTNAKFTPSDNITATSACFGFDSTINLYVILTSEIDLDESMIIITNEKGQRLDSEIDFDVEDIGGGQYRVCIGNIGSSRMNRMYTVRVQDDSKFKVSYSVANYCYDMVAQLENKIATAINDAEALEIEYTPDLSDLNLITLCKAIDKYAKAAKSYAGN